MDCEIKKTDTITEVSHYAGFWRRFVAVVIDYQVVAICLFPLFVILGFMVPNQVVVYVPFGLFSPEEVIDSFSEEVAHENGAEVVEVTNIIRQDVLGHWVYFYEETMTESVRDKNIKVTEFEERVLIDPETRNHLDWMELDDFIFWVLIAYWALMEGSRYRASIGKMAMGIQVSDCNGKRLTFLRALARNVSKFLSAFTFLIGFMMAGWTSKKQGLHDMVARCYVVQK